MNVTLLTFLTMCAFAANSFLCRAALGSGQIDPVSFTAIRLISGALVLWFCVAMQSANRIRSGSWPMALALLGYAVFFSLAYIQLSTGTGALVLFGCVQGTMIAFAASKGDRLRGVRAMGAALALLGLIVLLWPTLQVPASFAAFLSMALAGVCWGFYSIWGKGSVNPLKDTAGNFCRAGLIVAVLWAVVFGLIQTGIHIPGVSIERGLALHTVYLPTPTWSGVLLALASGVVASGLGYALWYRVLPLLPTTSAASVQLSVPVIAALAGFIVLQEPMTARLIVAMLMTLGGISLVLYRAGRP